MTDLFHDNSSPLIHLHRAFEQDTQIYFMDLDCTGEAGLNLKKGSEVNLPDMARGLTSYLGVQSLR